MALRSNQNMKSIQQLVFNLLRSQAIFCIGYNVNPQTTVAAILVFVECHNSIVFEVLVVLRPYQNVKPIRQAVFKISRSQAIVDRRTARQTDGQGHSIIRPVFRRAYKKTTRTNYLFTFENYRYVIFILSNAGLICGPCVLC